MRLSMPTIDWVRFPQADGEVPVATQPLDVLLQAAVDAGFDTVGIDAFVLGRPDAPQGSPRAALEAHGLTASDVGVLAVGQGDGLADAQRFGALAQDLGVRTCVTVLDAEPTDEVIAKVRGCADILAGHGVRLALEFLPYGPLASLDETLRVCEAVGWQDCGVLLDTWHFFNSGEPWDLLASMTGDQIALVQVNDAPEPIGDDQQFESRFRRVPMGEGRFDLPRFGAALRAIGYDGLVSPEVLSADLVQRPPAEVAAILRRSLEGLGW